MEATETPTTAAETASGSGVGPAAEARADCDDCIADEFPCFEHYEARCAGGEDWCNADGYGATDGAVCLSCAGITFDR